MWQGQGRTIGGSSGSGGSSDSTSSGSSSSKVDVGKLLYVAREEADRK